MCVVRMVVGREGAWAFRGVVASGTGVVFSVLGLVLRLGIIFSFFSEGGVNFGFGFELRGRTDLVSMNARAHIIEFLWTPLAFLSRGGF